MNLLLRSEAGAAQSGSRRISDTIVVCPERSATSAYHRVCHADKGVRLDFMADTTWRSRQDKFLRINEQDS